MPDDVGGRPSQDGWEPDDDRGGADEDFASVVFDEDFVQAAEIHEPTAVERLLAAAQARAEAEAGRPRSGGGAVDDDLHADGYGPDGLYGRGRGHGGARDPDGHDDVYGDEDSLYSPYGRHGGALRPYRSTARWHRPIAWLLALLMGIGMVALAFSAVYRGASGNRQEQAPPATSGVDQPGGVPSASAGYSRPAVSAVPRTP
ncbi:membrane protein [Streptomyces sp. NRRL WC-3549]|uniref:SCO2584 family spore wall biosynthesis protein n=1 Tax=Streptomyces sp. NRRL WC-3549 TaxID=1463925 RepID=UPI0004C56485|nr:membrane protein [Streptomyces sp. NRRL WC-3549]